MTTHPHIDSYSRDSGGEFSAPSSLDKNLVPSIPTLLLNSLVALSARRRFVALSVLIGLLIGGLLAVVMKDKYTATTSILPPQQGSSSSSALLSQLSSFSSMAGLGYGGAIKNPLDQYAGFFQSATVEDGMVKQFDLLTLYHAKRKSDAINILQHNTVIDAKGKDGLLKLSVTDKDPQRAAAMANGYVEQVLKLTKGLAITEASQRRLFLQQQLEQVKDKLADAEEDLKRTEETTGVIQIDAQGRALILAAETLRAQIAAKEVQVQSIELYASKDNPELQQAQQQLKVLRTQLSNLNGQGDSGLTGTKGQLSAAGLQYVRKQREVKYEETLFAILARQFEAAKMDEAHDGSVLQVVDAAQPPDHASKPLRPLIVIGFGFLGFVIACGWVMFTQAWENMLREPSAAKSFQMLRQGWK